MDKTLITVRAIGDADIESLIFHRLNYLREMQGEKEELYLKQLSIELLVFFTEGLNTKTFFGLVAEYCGEPVSFGGMGIRKIPGDFNG